MKFVRPRGAALALCLVLGLSCSQAGPAFAQAASPSPLPEPYSAEEFPAWSRSLRRWEIISIGVFPIALFYTRFAMDTSRFVQNGFQARFAPWPFKNEYSYAPSADEQRAAVAVAAGLALGVGILDMILLQRREAARGAEAP